jgi:hypothetical protein
MEPRQRTAEKLARVVMAGPFTLVLAKRRVRAVCGRCPRWLEAILRKLIVRYGAGSRPRSAVVARAIGRSEGLALAVIRGRIQFIRPVPAPDMCPAAGAPYEWSLPPIRTPAELAAYLGLASGELEWFADPRQMNRRADSGRLGHYTYRWMLKREGGARLIESPKLRLKLIQRRILRELLANIPPHDAAHGFRPTRSIRSYVRDHTGKAVVLRFDLRDFFPSITRARVQAIFMTAGYPEPVALRLAGICTAGVPRPVLDAGPAENDPFRTRLRNQRYAAPHLPQGAPSSPALANLAAFHLDVRLGGLARTAGANYSRYADDLLFSGGPEFARRAAGFAITVGAIALKEGFELNYRKTRLQRQGVSQRAAGMVLNSHANVPRAEFDRLKAILHNCARFGPESQNRAANPEFRSHLLGSIAHVIQINPSRGARLKAIFERIEW